MKGDAHDIGKNLVRIMLESRDIEVADLGKQVPPESFVEHVRNNANCNLVLISVNRTELLDRVTVIIDALKKAKLRDQVFVMVGGAAADPEFAEEIGADAFTASAEDAAAKAYELMSCNTQLGNKTRHTIYISLAAHRKIACSDIARSK